MDERRSHQRPNNAPSVSEKQRSECSELIADWIAIYEGNFGKEPTGATIAAYRIGLSDLKPNLLHKAFAGCLRSCSFWPNVAEIRAAYRAEAENAISVVALPEHDDSMTREESKKIFADIEKRFKETKAWESGQLKKESPSKVYVTLTEYQWEARKQLLKQQAAKLTEKWKAKGA